MFPPLRKHKSDIKSPRNRAGAVFALARSFIVEVTNLLDRTNATIINPVTGRAYEYGDPTPSGWNDPLYPDLQAPLNPYPYNLARYLAPRNIRAGVSVKF